MVFCSKNVNRSVVNSVTDICGSSLNSILGNYLSVPLIHKRISRNMYNGVLDKMKSKLTGWIGKNLTLAGRTTPIKSMLNSIPIYSMSTVKLPISICNEIDKINRSFLWSNPSLTKAMHLIN